MGLRKGEIGGRSGEKGKTQPPNLEEGGMELKWGSASGEIRFRQLLE